MPISRLFIAVALIAFSTAHAQHINAVPVHTFTAHTGEARELTFSPDGKLLATSSIDSTVRLWRVADQKLVAILRHPVSITSVAFSPDSRSLVSGSYDGQLRLWDVTTGTLTRSFKANSETVWSVDFAPDGQRVASTGEDKTIRIWRASDGALLHTLVGHTANVWRVMFSPDAAHIVSGSFDKNAKIWRTDTGALERTLTGSTQAIVGLAISPDGKLLATGGDDSSVRLWRMSDGHLMKTIPTGNHVFSVAFTPDGQWLATGGRARGPVGTFWHQLVGDKLSGPNSTTVRLWRVSDGSLQQELKGHSDDLWALAISPDGRWLATGSEDHTVKLWKLSTASGKIH